MKRSPRDLQGVDVLDSASQFRPCRHAARVYDLGSFGLPWIPVIGWTSFPEKCTETSWHVHRDCIEVIYCSSGRCEYGSCGNRYRFMPRHVFVSQPDEPHRLSWAPKGHSTFFLHIRPSRKGGAEEQWLFSRLRSLPRLFIGGTSVPLLFGKVLSLVEADPAAEDPGVRLRVRTGVMSLLFAVLDSTVLALKRTAASPVQPVIRRMRSCPERAYPLKLLAEEAGMSAASFINEFKRETGYPPHAYLQNCRIEKATQLLAGGFTVKDTAAQLGFSSPQHLAAQFRKIEGCSPLAWQRRRRT